MLFYGTYDNRIIFFGKYSNNMTWFILGIKADQTNILHGNSQLLVNHIMLLSNHVIKVNRRTIGSMSTLEARRCRTLGGILNPRHTQIKTKLIRKLNINQVTVFK